MKNTFRPASASPDLETADATSAETPRGAAASQVATAAAATNAAAAVNAKAIRLLMVGLSAGFPPAGRGYCCLALYFWWQPPQLFL